MDLTHAEQVWNRAAMENGGSDPGIGDRSLSALLLLHGMVMNGGVGHATESLSTSEFSEGLDGFRFFGLIDVANLLESALLVTENEIETCDQRYWDLIPADSTILQAFERYFSSTPDSFSQLK